MSVKIVKAEKVAFPACCLIGRRYTDADRKDGGYYHKWWGWFTRNLFAPLDRLPRPEGDAFCDGSPVGAMRIENGMFEYWIGKFFPADTPSPEGYAYVDLPESRCALFWIYGNGERREIYGMEAARLRQDEMERQGWTPRENGWWIEHYNCPRFTTPDDDGNVILDYGIFLKE